MRPSAGGRSTIDRHPARLDRPSAGTVERPQDRILLNAAEDRARQPPSSH